MGAPGPPLDPCAALGFPTSRRLDSDKLKLHLENRAPTYLYLYNITSVFYRAKHRSNSFSPGSLLQGEVCENLGYRRGLKWWRSKGGIDFHLRSLCNASAQGPKQIVINLRANLIQIHI